MVSIELPPNAGSLSALSLAAVVFLASPAMAQQAQCADALGSDAAPEWETTALIAADLTLDGVVDAAYWRVDGAELLLLIGACDGREVARRWPYAFDIPDGCPAAKVGVQAVGLLVDEALVERACAGERSASECAHLRRENERRRALMNAGGRALRVGAPSCTVGTLRWSPEMNGFMWIRG